MNETLINRAARGFRLSVPKQEIIAMLKDAGLSNRDAHFTYMMGKTRHEKEESQAQAPTPTIPEDDHSIHTWENEGGC